MKKLIQFIVEPTIFGPRLKFKPQLKFFKFGLWLNIGLRQFKFFWKHVPHFRLNAGLLHRTVWVLMHTTSFHINQTKSIFRPISSHFNSFHSSFKSLCIFSVFLEYTFGLWNFFAYMSLLIQRLYKNVWFVILCNKILQ